MTRTGVLNDNFKVETEPDTNDKDKGDSAEKTAMKNLGEVLRLAREAKKEALRKAEEEAKKKEANQTQPMTSMQNMAAAIKRAKEEKKAREEAERIKKEQ
jgi:hypothetical protein